MRRKSIALLGVAALAGGALAACSPADGGDGEIVLTYLNHYANESQKPLIDQILRDFEEKHPGVTIRNVTTGPDTEDSEYRTQLAAGNAPDVFSAVRSSVVDFAARGQLTTVDFDALGMSAGDFESLYYPAVLNGYQDEAGDYVAVPETIGNYLTWVNTAAFDEAGVAVPTTWDEVCAAGPRLLKKDDAGNVTQMLLTLPTTDTSSQFIFLDGVIRSFGGSLFSADNTKAQLDSGPVVEAFTMLQRLVTECEATVPALNPPAQAGNDRTAFSSGLAAMLFTGGSWMPALMTEPIVPPVAQAVANPSGPDGSVSPAYGYGWVVSTTSKHPDLAWALVGALAQSGKDFLTFGVFNGQKEIAELPEAADLAPQWEETWLPSLDTVAYAAPFETGESAQIISDAYIAILNGADVADTLERAQSALQSAVDKKFGE